SGDGGGQRHPQGRGHGHVAAGEGSVRSDDRGEGAAEQGQRPTGGEEDGRHQGGAERRPSRPPPAGGRPVSVELVARRWRAHAAARLDGLGQRGWPQSRRRKSEWTRSQCSSDAYRSYRGPAGAKPWTASVWKSNV